MAGDASRQNGKKGGRPKGYAALEAEKARVLIAEKLTTEFAPIVEKAIEQAKDGNQQAREWLTDRAYGKAQAHLDLTTKDEAINSLADLPTPELERLTEEGQG